jgi:cation diffusion facilitator family transporter
MNNEVEKIKRLGQGQRIAWIASLLTLFLAIVKGAVGYRFDSPLLVADAVHSAGDVVTIAASGFGLWFAARKKSEKFPYGLYKAETLAGLFIGAFILWAGVEMAREGYAKLLHSSTAPGFPFLPVIATILSIIVNYFLAKKEKEVGKFINSQSLQIKAYETVLDIYVSCAVLIGLLLAFLGVPYAEGVLIMAISLLILKLGVQTVWICLLSLLDANLDPELQTEIVGKVAEMNGVMGVTQVRVRRSGPFRMVDCTIESSPNLPLYRAHELADKIEDTITGDYKEIETVFVHVEPSRERVHCALIPVAEINGLDSRIHGHFGRAPYFVVVRFDGNDFEIVDFYYNEFLGEKIHIGVKIIKALTPSGLSMLFTRSVGELSFYMLKDNFIDIYRVDEELTVREIVQAYRKKRLPILTTPTHPLEESETVTHETEGTTRVRP